jgi:hypothetical protein
MIRETLLLIDHMFLIAIVIVYFDYISSLVGLILWNLRNCSYSVYPIDSWVDDEQYVDMMSRYSIYLRVHPDVLGRVIVRVSDSYVNFSIVHPPYVGKQARLRSWVMTLFHILPR